MKRVGILVGREKTFPEALIRNINERGQGAVTADFITLGGVRYDAPPPYDLVIDRISHEVPFYRATLKRLALEGAIIINNLSGGRPTTSFSISRWRGNSASPCPGPCCCRKRTTSKESSARVCAISNFLDWQAIIDYVGLPAIMKPFDGGGLEERFARQHAGRVDHRIRSDRHVVHDSAGVRRL